ncbi:MAG: phycobilisome degradation protein NblA, partial [Merismopedia sp. SIO2A8]|nr:phycobilisome degradation protein NblA [Merismopedia sp. SIO2A8]
QSLDVEQARGYILELMRQMMVKDNIVKDLLRAEL